MSLPHGRSAMHSGEDCTPLSSRRASYPGYPSHLVSVYQRGTILGDANSRHALTSCYNIEWWPVKVGISGSAVGIFMRDKKVTSHNQQGGITAYEVNAGDNSRRSLPLWATWLVGAATVAGVIAAVVFGIQQL